ncbi:tRNA pseudouridine(55) synthase TruB [Candidatus Saccharibacteria bacterium]|nr:tRNA pseudouridine(55) synthase TruB [Candidatus Saccharibacteria bacterium]
MFGILLVDKPSGWTSHDVVAKVRGILRQATRNQQPGTNKQLISDSLLLTSRAPKMRVGHAGTLDPMATGLLIILVGSYTKRADEFLKLDKTYDAQLTLGATSSTGDAEGRIIEGNKQQVTGNKVKAVLESFVGEIEQTPPAHSAIKVDGQRAYKLARAGKKPELKPRKVRIYEIGNIKYRFPRLSFEVRVSSGTYIRSLAEDIGQKLGTGAYLSALRRTRIGNFDINQAVQLSDLPKQIKFAKV